MSGADAALIHAMKGAIVNDDVERVRELLADGCSPNLDINPGPYPYPLLEMPAGRLQYEMCKVLLDAGADAKGWPEHNHIPLRTAAGSGSPRGADWNESDLSKRLAVCRLLLERGADPNDAGSGKCETTMHLALRGVNTPETSIPLLRLLMSFGGDPGYVPPGASSEYRTPLHAAVYFSNVDVVRFFIEECGQDPFQKTVAGRSLLQLCTGSDAADCKAVIKDAQNLLRSSRSRRAIAAAIDESEDVSPAPAKRSSFAPL